MNEYGCECMNMDANVYANVYVNVNINVNGRFTVYRHKGA